MVTTLPLESLPLDGVTFVRSGIDLGTSRTYAYAMLQGAIFPPISVIFDGTRYYPWDGHHRVHGRKLAGFPDITADVEPGTLNDALWLALGANKAIGKRLTLMDKKHAVAIALKTFPEKVFKDIAEQVGCHQSLVSKVAEDLRKVNGSETAIFGRARQQQQKRDAVRELLLKDRRANSIDIKGVTGANTHLIAAVRRELGQTAVDYSRKAVKARRLRMEELAKGGHTSRQIAAELAIREETVRNTCRRLNINVVADKVTSHSRHLNSRRILERIVLDAENLTEAGHLINCSELERAELAEWIGSLKASRDKFSAFIRHLMEEQAYGEAAAHSTSPAQGAAGRDFTNARPAGAADATAVPSEPRRTDSGGV